MRNKYLFCYFTGNEPDEESVHFALSENGYHFTALNHNKKIITQTLGKKCCRDPFIFRNENGGFHIIATDMCCKDGWNSNNSIVVWDSKDLIHWKNERIIDFSRFSETENADRIWAPEAVFDKSQGEYMLYFSCHNKGDEKTVIWYAYTKDFKTLTTSPAILFTPKSGKDGIDADIIENSKKYYLYYKDEYKKTICHAVSDSLAGPYYEPENNIVCCTDLQVEGNCIYRINDTDAYIMIMDKYVDGGYFMQKTTDMITFTKVDEDRFSLNHLHPRHGSVLAITDEEFDKLKNIY
ncbi:MAG: glycoside hydrolase family 43 protein [Eubacterium sp.]|jgi:hypothetical protein|nr:glycoside hydrolase family 43 protein [Eubacterium sp.]